MAFLSIFLFQFSVYFGIIVQIDFEFRRRSRENDKMPSWELGKNHQFGQDFFSKISHSGASGRLLPVIFMICWHFCNSNARRKEKLFRTRHTIKRQFSVPLISIKNDCRGTDQTIIYCCQYIWSHCGSNSFYSLPSWCLKINQKHSVWNSKKNSQLLNYERSESSLHFEWIKVL